MIFNTSLLREKFLIQEHTETGETSPIQAVGNRIALPLSHGTRQSHEHFIIRGKLMHCTTRMAAAMAEEFERAGPLLPRLNETAWDNFWQDSQTAFDEYSYGDNWIAVYHEGNPIYSRGKYHPFLSVMEQCDARNRAEYDKAIQIAENVFKQAGKIVHIDHETTISCVAGVMEHTGRSGLVLRYPGRNATFTFHMSPLAKGKRVYPHHLLDMSADYMEVLNLSVNIGKRSHDDKAGSINYLGKAKTRLGQVNERIRQFENLFQFKYRPEKPDFFDIIKETEDET